MVNEENKSIGENIKEIIEKLGYSQKEVSVGTDIAESNLSRIIKGHAVPSISTLKKLAEFLQVPVESFHNGEILNIELQNKFLDSLPNELREAFKDTRNQEYLLFGLETKNSEVPLDEIRIAIDMIKSLKQSQKKK